jgi:hypothetical protein
MRIIRKNHEPADPESIRNADATNRRTVERRRILSRRSVVHRHAMAVAKARAVLFVLSPQFAKGGDWVPFRLQATHEELAALLHRARSGERV